jgi:hypothetical protein
MLPSVEVKYSRTSLKYKICLYLNMRVCFPCVNPLKPSGNYIYHRFLQSVILHIVLMDLVRFSV